MNLFCDYYHSPIGQLRILANNTHLLGVDYKDGQDISIFPNFLIKETIIQLKEYFLGKRKIFSIPIDFIKGTEFQRQVWIALLSISYGETCSYKDIAKFISRPKAVRVVGNTNRLNPISIIIPCHRVIGINKQLVGYAGGLDKKEFLLKHELKHH